MFSDKKSAILEKVVPVMMNVSDQELAAGDSGRPTDNELTAGDSSGRLMYTALSLCSSMCNSSFCPKR